MLVQLRPQIQVCIVWVVPLISSDGAEMTRKALAEDDPAIDSDLSSETDSSSASDIESHYRNKKRANENQMSSASKRIATNGHPVSGVVTTSTTVTIGDTKPVDDTDESSHADTHRSLLRFMATPEPSIVVCSFWILNIICIESMVVEFKYFLFCYRFCITVYYSQFKYIITIIIIIDDYSDYVVCHG